ncbi:hypothetical protein [Lysobacter gummosus]
MRAYIPCPSLCWVRATASLAKCSICSALPFHFGSRYSNIEKYIS